MPALRPVRADFTLARSPRSRPRRLQSGAVWLGSGIVSESETTPAGEPLPRSPVFVTTHWSVVLTAGGGDTTGARRALAKLCQTYWYPLYAYVRRRSFSPPDAEDLTQEFFARFLEHRLGGQRRPRERPLPHVPAVRHESFPGQRMGQSPRPEARRRRAPAPAPVRHGGNPLLPGARRQRDARNSTSNGAGP